MFKSSTSPPKAPIFPKFVFVSYHRTLGEIKMPTPSQMSSRRGFHPAFKATHKINTRCPSTLQQLLPLSPNNGRPFHPPPRHSLQIALPLHPCPLNRSCLRYPSSRRSPLHHCSKRALLRPLRLAYISFLHSAESISAYYQGKVCSSGLEICEACVAERAGRAEGCTGCGIELETAGFECGGGVVGYSVYVPNAI